MEQNLQTMGKKFWNMVRVAYFMLRKGISKGKLLADLNFMLKRGKIAGKLSAIHNLMFHHRRRHDHASASAVDGPSPDRYLSYPTLPNEYEFSCSSTPVAYSAFRIPFNLNKRKHAHAPPPVDDSLMAEALDIVTRAAASPSLLGFGPNPRKLVRVTDSPFPLREIEEDDAHVDEAAEEFISKFYRNLRLQQNSSPYLSYS